MFCRIDAVKNKQGFPHYHERVWVKKLIHERKIHFRSWDICMLIGKIYGNSENCGYEEDQFHVPTLKLNEH